MPQLHQGKRVGGETYRKIAARVALHVAIVLDAMVGSAIGNARAAPGEHAYPIVSFAFAKLLC